MAEADKYMTAIRKVLTHEKLLEIWNEHKENREDDFWAAGKLMEHIVLRAFELESKDDDKIEVAYPFDVRDEYVKSDVEQFDGAIHHKDLHALIECKDYEIKHIDIVPLAKLRFRLQMRHSSVFGLFFSSSSMTETAEYLMKFMSPQLIIYWDVDDFEFCLKHACFKDCLNIKYRYAIERREYNFHYYQLKKDLEECPKLF